MNVKPLLILALFSLLLVGVGISRANVSSTQFTILLDGAGGLGFQNSEDMNLTLTVSSGTLNSTNSYLSMTHDEGRLTFNSSKNVVLQFHFNGCQASIKHNGVSNAIGYGDTVSIAANEAVRIRWYWEMADWIGDWFMAGMGLGGIVLVCFGSFWGVRQIRGFKGETDILSLGWAMMIILIGLGLLIGWLW